MVEQWRRVLLATSALVPLTLAPALAGPNGATVVGGAATVQGQGTASVVVNQSTQNAIINWQTFNIGVGETTRINMPSASSVQLDRVTGGLGPSQILGSLSSNGKVFLVNPDGILFGGGAQINVGSLLATTHDIANSDFMAGRYNFTIPGNPSASIVNQGSITAQTGGFAALVAPGVRNTGTITAKLGTVALASGNGFTLDLYGDNLITLGVSDSIASQVIDVSTGKPLTSLVSNESRLRANGGTVQLTAVAARRVVDSVINNTGVIEANSIGSHNGKIVLGAATGANKPVGAPIQTVQVSGTLSAAGKRKGTKGGTIQITGEDIEVRGATINASGQSGGGAVLVGGDWGGGTPNANLVSNQSAYLQPYAVPTATNVSIDAATLIDASAMRIGNGGKVIVWSDQATMFYGTILAAGGSGGGNGGFVETSGHQLTFNGAVDTSAPLGRTGTWLLDPTDLTIDASAAATISANLSNTDVTLQTNADGTTSGPGNASSGLGDIIVGASISWVGANTLTLNAYHDITINDGVTITNTGAGNLNLRADAAGIGAGTVNFIGSGNVNFSATTGAVSIFYNPSDNPAGSSINSTSYVTPTDYSPHVSSLLDRVTAYMLVNSVYDLQNIQNNLTGDYALGRNIDASGTASWNGGAGFTPIASAGPVFFGVIEGQGHVIDDLTINSNNQSVGLIAVTAGFVDNLGVTNESVFASATTGGLFGAVGGIAGRVQGGGLIGQSFSTGSVVAANDLRVGGLVGENDGIVFQSYSTVSVTGGAGSIVGGLVGSNGAATSPPTGTIANSYATGTVTGGAFAGGLAGSNAAVITQSYASGSVNGTGTSSLIPTDISVGGLVGLNLGTISQSFATGPAMGVGLGTTFPSTSMLSTNVGGLVGGNSGSVINSFATGSVFVGAGQKSYAGGLIGLNGDGGFVPNAGVTGSYAVGPVSGAPGALVGGLIGNLLPVPGVFINSYWDSQSTGQPTSAGGTPMTTANLTSALPTGFDPSTWAINPGASYPYLQWQPAGTIPKANVSPNANMNPNVACVACVQGIDQVTNAIAGFAKNAVTGAETALSDEEKAVVGLLQDAAGILTGASSFGGNSAPSGGANGASSQAIWNDSNGLYVTNINGKQIAVAPQQENLNLSDCEATVFAMIGNFEAAISGTAPSVPYTSSNYEDSSGVASRTGSTGAPTVQLADIGSLTVPFQNAVGFALNTSLFAKNPLQKLTSFPAIIGGTITGEISKQTLPHFMLAIGIDPTGQYIIANDPLTGKQVEIYRSGPQLGQVAKEVVSATQVKPFSDGDQGFQAVGFVGIAL